METQSSLILKYSGIFITLIAAILFTGISQENLDVIYLLIGLYISVLLFGGIFIKTHKKEAENTSQNDTNPYSPTHPQNHKGGVKHLRHGRKKLEKETVGHKKNYSH